MIFATHSPLPWSCTKFSTIWTSLPPPVPCTCTFDVHRCSWTPNVYNCATFRSYKLSLSRILECTFHVHVKHSYVHTQDLVQSCSWPPACTKFCVIPAVNIRYCYNAYYIYIWLVHFICTINKWGAQLLYWFRLFNKYCCIMYVFLLFKYCFK